MPIDPNEKSVDRVNRLTKEALLLIRGNAETTTEGLMVLEGVIASFYLLNIVEGGDDKVMDVMMEHVRDRVARARATGSTTRN